MNRTDLQVKKREVFIRPITINFDVDLVTLVCARAAQR